MRQFPPSLPGLTRQSIPFVRVLLARKMDGRIKSGHDDWSASLSRSVVDIALPAQTATALASSTRARALDRMRLGDLGFRVLTRAAAIAVLLILGAVILSLVSGSLP